VDSNNFSFIRFFSDIGNGITEDISFNDIPLAVQKNDTFEESDYWNLYNGIPSATIGWLLEFDQGIGIMKPNLSRDNWLEVTHLDLEAKTVEGRFQVFLRKQGNGSYAWFGQPDTIAMTDGKFYLKLE
jgi:hypothetical protein